MNTTTQITIKQRPEPTGTIQALNTLRNLKLWRQWQEERQRRQQLADDVREAVEEELVRP